MVKCVVSGCPNRQENVKEDLGVCGRGQKKFFSFPNDPERVKVWLAALKETGKQDSTEQHLICEDHFLPQDISKNEVNSEAIPSMSLYLDGPVGAISSWSAEVSGDEDRWEDDNNTNEGGHSDPGKITEPPAPVCHVPEALTPVRHVEEPSLPQSCTPESHSPKLCLQDLPEHDNHVTENSETKPRTPESSAVDLPSAKNPPVQEEQQQQLQPPLFLLPVFLVPQGTSNKKAKCDLPREQRAQRYLQMLLTAPCGRLDIRQVCQIMQIKRGRVLEMNNVLRGANLLEKESTHIVRWKGSCQRPSSLAQREMEDMKLVEETLDSLIKSCFQQLFDITNDTGNAALAYLTLEDINRLEAFKEQTVMVVKAPEETKLEVPAPTQKNIQLSLKAGNSPIMVLTCDVETEDVTVEESCCFFSLEESRIKTSELQKGTVNSPLPALESDVGMQEDQS